MIEGFYREQIGLMVQNQQIDILYTYWENPPQVLYVAKGMHAHSFTEVFCAADQPNTFNIDGKEVAITPGQALIVAPNVLHYAMTAATARTSFLFSLCTPTGKLRKLTPKSNYRILSGVDVSIMLMIYQEAHQKQAGFREKLNALFELCILDLARNSGITLLDEQEPYTRYQYAMTIEEYITTHITNSRFYGKDTGKENLAGELNMSLRKLERIVQDAFGMSYSELYSKHKFRLAKRLLTEMKWKVKDVSAYLGYAEESAFSRAFAKYYGVSPANLSLSDSHLKMRTENNM